MIISEIWIFYLPDFDQGIQKHVIQKKRGVLSVFEKSYEEKRKKNPILVYPGLRYTHKKLNFACKIFFSKNVCLNTKINLRLEKKHEKFLGAISKILRKIFVVAIKKMLVIQFPYMEIVWLVFFFRKQK